MRRTYVAVSSLSRTRLLWDKRWTTRHYCLRDRPYHVQVLACSQVSYRTDPGRIEVGARELEVIGHAALRRRGPSEKIRRREP
jgi:hypothetical protein